MKKIKKFYQIKMSEANRPPRGSLEKNIRKRIMQQAYTEVEIFLMQKSIAQASLLSEI